MNWQTGLVIALLLLSTGIGIGISVFSWQRKDVPGAAAFTALAAALAVWSLTYALELGAADLETKILWAQFQYAGIATIPVAWFIFAQQYSRREHGTKKRHIVLLSIIPAATITIAFTNQAHGLLWSGISLNADGALRTFDASYGPWWWLFFLYSYSLLFWGAAVLLYSLRIYSRTYRGQFALLLFGLLLPWLANALYISRLSPVPQLDLGPFAFTLSALILGLGVFRYHLFDLYPVARFSMVDSLRTAAFVLDLKGRMVDWNSAVDDMLSQEIDPIGKPVDEVFAWWKQVDEVYATSIEVQQDVHIQLSDVERWFNLQITPLWDREQKLSGRLVLLRDITADKLAEEAIALAQVKTEFLAKVGHELRTPLTSILGVTEMLDYGIYGPLTNRQSEGLKLLRDSTQQMVRLVNDLMQQANLEQGGFSLDIADFEVVDLVERVRNQLIRAARAKEINFTTEVSSDVPRKLRGDSMRLYQIMINLVENAIKYTEKGSIRLHAYRYNETKWAVEVSDTGIGIPRELQEHIFRPYQRVTDSLARRQGGLGLGLSIVKQLVILMGGQISLESDAGKGSIFRVVLPLEIVEEIENW